MEITGFAFEAKVCYRFTETGLNVNFDLGAEQPGEAGILVYYDLKKRDSAAVWLSLEGQPEALFSHFDRRHADQSGV